MIEANTEDRFVEMVTESQGIIHKVCNIYCDDREHRKDLFQEILIQLWKSFGSFKGEAKFSTWMYRVSLNVALQYVRKEQKKPRQTQLSDEMKNLSDTISDDSYEEDLKQLYQAISQLNDIEKAIIMLYLEDRDNEEIAEIIGISQNYVRVRMNRSKEKLKRILNAQ
ncbi:RNA polymerase sigma factor [Roseivirga sp. 4D4]|uniref:RNA polymerase sigma factor n=1 Tax=Roseivirga sp. 4D4 TaxID=1889784 RepID=UPI000AA0206F|nr:sigma-70 family RNA polymerase sigma factor [Roseivirga sp. 4D4]